MTNTEVGPYALVDALPRKNPFCHGSEQYREHCRTPGKVVFQYQEYLTGNVLETEQNTNGLDSVQPFEAKTVTAEMPTYLPQGSYRVFYQIYGADSANVIGQGTLDLAILPPGTLRDMSDMVSGGFDGARNS